MFLLFDIGGTHMRVAISRDGKKVTSHKLVPTPEKFEEGIRKLAELAHEMTGEKTLKAAAGGIPGVFNAQKTEILHSPNLPKWDNRPLKKEIAAATGVPHVFLENDAALAGLGEATWGAGRGMGIVAYVTISTGVGGVRIVDGAIDKNAIGFEPGWHIVDWQKKEMFEGCKTRGYLEDYIGGNTLERCFGKKLQQINDKKVWTAIEELVAVYLNNVTVFWSPDIIVVGGSTATKSSNLSFDRIEKRFKELAKVRFPNPPPIKKALLDDIGGLQGALVYLKQQITMNLHGEKS